jgi:hypothetical protein
VQEFFKITLKNTPRRERQYLAEFYTKIDFRTGWPFGLLTMLVFDWRLLGRAHYFPLFYVENDEGSIGS